MCLNEPEEIEQTAEEIPEYDLDEVFDDFADDVNNYGFGGK